MLIDWFTVIAQVVNFLILVWLLKRFLYGPILNAIDAREKRIAAELAEADAKKAEALKEREEFQRKNEEFDGQHAALLSKAKEEVQAERRRLMDEARQAANVLSAKRQETLRSEVHSLNQSITRRTRQEVFSIARKALADLAGASLEERMVGVFVRRLQEMDEQAKKGFGESLKTVSEPALVRSAFDLPAAQRAAIQKMLNATFSAEINIRFETAPEQVSGIELISNGHKLAWSISDYLASLEKGVDELLKEQGKLVEQARIQGKKPSELTQRIGKRAYELYEEHGHKEGLAARDWETAEREIREEISEPAKTVSQPQSIEIKPDSEKPEPQKTDPKAKPQAKTEADLKDKPEIKEASEPVEKAAAESAVKAEPKSELKPEAKAKPGLDAEVKPDKKVASEPSTKPVPEASKPGAKSP